MTRYIDKSALVAEIEKMIYEAYPNSEWNHGYVTSCEKILSFLNSLEVKEVDLEKEIKDYFDSQPIITRSKGVDYRLIPTGVDIAKHFYELGIKATQKGE